MSQVHPPRSHAIHSRVRSFSRAGGRLTDAQARALERHGRRYVVEVPRADAIRTVDPPSGWTRRGCSGTWARCGP